MTSLSTYQECLAAHQEQAWQINFDIANHPEISGEEVHACAAYIALCRSLGMEVTPCFTGQATAFRAAARHAASPVLRAAILAEYDALPAIGHGCGHSANGAMSFLTAAALRDMPALPVQVDLLGTPDEELRGGKVCMCEQHVFEAYDLALMVHVTPTLTTPNSRFLALDDYRIQFHGQTAHAAGDPWHGRNALNGAMLALHAMDMLRQHVRPETRIGTYIVQGGTASNVIPDEAEIECCIRHTERAYLDEVVQKVMRCAEGAAIATDTTYDVRQMGYKFDDMVWNETLTDISRQALRDMGIPFAEPGNGGSSDIGNVSHQCPALHVHLAMGDVWYPDHSAGIASLVKSEGIKPVIVRGAELMGRIILKLAEQASLRRQMKDEFARTVRL